MGDSIATRRRHVQRGWTSVVVLGLVLGCSSGRQRPARVAPPPPRPASTQVSQPAEIRSLELRGEGEIAYLDVVADRPLVWTNYRDSLGNLVVELPNSVPAAGVGNVVTQQGLVASVEIERLDDAERPLTRLVVRTREDSEHSLTTEGSILQLQLLPAGYEEPVELAYQPIPEESAGAPAAGDPAAGDPAAGAPAARVGTADRPLAGPAPRGVKASQLTAVDVERHDQATTIFVAGDGEFAYSTFRLESPERFVIDLEGVVNMSERSSVEVGGDFVERVRVGQFKPRPDAVSRVVLDLRRGVVPVIGRTADGLAITFGAAPSTLAQDVGAEASLAEVEEPTPEEPAPPAVTAEAGEEEAPSVPLLAPGTPEPAAPEPAAPQPAAPQPPAAELATAPPEPPVTRFQPTQEPLPTGEAMAVAEPPADRPAPRAPQPGVTRPGATRDVSMFEAQEVEGLEEQEERPYVPRFAATVVSRQDREYLGEPINMSLKNADLVETLRSFASISGLNFVIQPGVTGSVTVELNQVPWDQAMEQILKINNLGMAIEGTIVRIAPADQLRREAEHERELAAAQRRSIPLRTVMKTLSYASANEVSALLRNRSGAILSERGTVQVDQRTNSLIIRELPSNIDTVLAVIENLDTPEPQVTIEARIIEATKQFSRTLGIQWGFDAAGNNELGNTTGLQFPNNYDVDGGVGLLTGGANGFLNLSMGNILNSFNLNAAIQAAENEGLVNIISAPSVTTLNNFPAQIQSGLQIPIQTVTNRTVSVQFVNATLQLVVRPHVTAEGTIILNLNVAKRAPQLAFAVVGATNAPIATKEASTTVVVRDGGTAVIGGVYEVSTSQSHDRVPGLANIPILGHLFKNRERSEENDELMIFVTPRIVQM